MNKFIYSGDVEEDAYYKTEGLKPEFEESVAERTKITTQKKSDDKHTTDIPELYSEESAEQKRNRREQELKILTPNQMLHRLPITCAIKSGK